jgi:hypothetical protein
MHASKDSPYVPKAEPIWKFCFLSLVTFGIYSLMWFYRQFRRIKEKYAPETSPFWRSFFAVFWVYGLFKSLQSESAEKNLGTGMNAALSAFGYILLFVLHKLPDPYWWISALAFLPVLPAVRTANEIGKTERQAPEGGEAPEGGGFSGLEWVLAVIGSLFFLLAIIGTFVSG